MSQRWNSHQVRKHHLVFERLGNPDQVERILIDAGLLREEGCVVGAKEVAAVRVDADAKVAYSHLEHGLSDNIGDCSCDARVDLRRVVVRGVVLIVKGDEEDAGDQGRGRRTSCEE